MDLRSVLNEDASNARRTAKAPPQQSPVAPSPGHGYFPRQHPPQTSPPAHTAYPGPPTPQSQYPPQHDFRPPSSAGPAGPHLQYSPGHAPSRSLTGGQYSFPQHPPQSPASAPHAPLYGSRDSYTSVPPPGGRSFTWHQSPGLQSPSGPPLSANSAQPPSLHQSISRPSPTPTPNSIRDPTPHSVRESPMSSHSSSHIHQQHHPSQPNTPLGPPPLSYQRSSTHGFREPISPHMVHQRTYSGASYAGSSMHSGSPPTRTIASAAIESPQAYARQSSERGEQERLEQMDRERSISVSPKTRVPTHSQVLDQRRSTSHDQFEGHVRQPQQEHYLNGRGHSTGGTEQTPIAPGVPLGPQASGGSDARIPQTSLSHLNAPLDGARGSLFRSAERDRQNLFPPDRTFGGHPAQSTNTFTAQHADTGSGIYAQSTGASVRPLSTTNDNVISPSNTMPTGTAQSVASADPSNGHAIRPESRHLTLAPTSEEALQESESRIHAGIKRESSSTVDALQPSRKRVRYSEPPIWARRSHLTPHIREQRPPQGPKQERGNSQLQSRSVTPIFAKSPTNGDVNGVRAPAAGPDFEETNDGPLGYWERCITNVEPYNDLTRIVTDFIYSELDQRPDIDVTEVGGIVSPNGQIEIEAKLGTLVDRRSNERIRLPVVSAVILDLEARRHIAFESFMTEVSLSVKFGNRPLTSSRYSNNIRLSTISSTPRSRSLMPDLHRISDPVSRFTTNTNVSGTHFTNSHRPDSSRFPPPHVASLNRRARCDVLKSG